MSLNSQESGALKGTEQCQIPDCELIVLDSIGNNDDTEDDIIFEKEVPGVSSVSLLAKSDNRASVIVGHVSSKEADGDIEVVCISSQESSCSVTQQESSNKGEDECEVIAITADSSALLNHASKRTKSPADSSEFLCKDLPPEIENFVAGISADTISPQNQSSVKDKIGEPTFSSIFYVDPQPETPIASEEASVDNKTENKSSTSDTVTDPTPEPSAVNEESSSTKDKDENFQNSPIEDQIKETPAATKESSTSKNNDDENPESSSSKVDDEVEEEEIELVMEPNLFCVDTQPEKSKKEKKLGPRFRREFNSTLKNEDKIENDEGARMDNRCFNCSENHTLAECPHPKNYQEINKNRSAYLKNQPKLTNRYHEEKEDRFSQFKPGVLSEPLRRALGLRSDDLPMHIYRMRLLGYPPGWIEEIKEYSSGLEFIDTPNSPDRGDTHQTISFDLSRVIDYPGFNAQLSPRCRDEWQYLNMPPMQPYHLKENFIEQLKRHAHEHNNAPRPKRIRFNSGKAEDPPNLEVIDMETEGENDTTIEDLEEKRLALLAQLHEQGSNSNSSKSDSGEVPIVTLDEDETAGKEEAPPVSDAVDSSEVDPTSPKASKLLEVGTPVAIRHSSFSSLPDREKFSKGMGDLELFENLPNSTGTFKKMRSLLEKVRRVFKKS